MSRPTATSRTTSYSEPVATTAVAGKRRKSWTIFPLDGRTHLPVPEALGIPARRSFGTRSFRPSPRASPRGAREWSYASAGATEKKSCESGRLGPLLSLGMDSRPLPVLPPVRLRRRPWRGPSGLGFFLTIVRETSSGLTQGRLDPVLSPRSVMNHCAQLEEPLWKWDGRPPRSTPTPEPGQLRGKPAFDNPPRSVDILWTSRGLSHGIQISRIDSAR